MSIFPGRLAFFLLFVPPVKHIVYSIFAVFGLILSLTGCGACSPFPLNRDDYDLSFSGDTLKVEFTYADVDPEENHHLSCNLLDLGSEDQCVYRYDPIDNVDNFYAEAVSDGERFEATCTIVNAALRKARCEVQITLPKCESYFIEIKGEQQYRVYEYDEETHEVGSLLRTETQDTSTPGLDVSTAEADDPDDPDNQCEPPDEDGTGDGDGGDEEPPADRDGDGVNDDIDECPDEAHETADGCEEEVIDEDEDEDDCLNAGGSGDFRFGNPNGCTSLNRTLGGGGNPEPTSSGGCRFAPTGTSDPMGLTLIAASVVLLLWRRRQRHSSTV